MTQQEASQLAEWGAEWNVNVWMKTNSAGAVQIIKNKVNQHFIGQQLPITVNRGFQAYDPVVRVNNVPQPTPRS